MKSMHCVEISSFENGGTLAYTRHPIPSITNHQVLIKVSAAGVNRPDLFQRAGFYPPPEGASDLPGLEVSGEIVEIGCDVANWQVGDKVCALLTGGGYAEYAAAEASICLPIPNGISVQEAAGIPETYFTVWANVFQRGQLKAGDNILIHGGSSGIGTTAIQLAKAFGANVFTTAGSDDKCQQCLALGADHAINYRDVDFSTYIKEHTNRKGVDIILDMVGGDYIQKNISAAAFRGRIISIAFLNGSKAEVDLMPVMLKQLTLTGSTLRTRPVDEKAEIRQQLLEQVWPLFEQQKLKPVTAAQFPLEAADEAHQLMSSSQHVGKILLTCEDA